MPSCWRKTSWRSILVAFSAGVVFNLQIETSRPGFVLFRCVGVGAVALFRPEAGGHRWQRIPPTEKRGRVHTSTVTVAVLPVTQTKNQIQLDPKDLQEKFVVGSGPGGQHRNKTATGVVLTHVPTGVTVRIENARSQHRNRQTALEVLQTSLQQQQQHESVVQKNKQRRRQVGTGMRGDKIRTIQLRRGRVTDHRTGKTMPVDRYLRGFIEELH